MNIRYLIGAAAVTFVVAGAQAKATTITTDLGSLSGGVFYDVISVDHTGILNYAGSNAPATLIQSNTVGDHSYAGAASSGQYDFTFSVNKASTLNATAYTTTTFPGTTSVNLYGGATNLGSNLKNIALTPGIEYELAVTGASAGQGLYVLKGDVSPVPVPAALPLFASALLGFGFLAMRKQRRA